MKKQLITSLTKNFELYTQQTEEGVEYWLARDVQRLLGYEQWRNFSQVISKAKIACEMSGHAVLDHFADVSKMVKLGSDTEREINDVMLTRYACYLVAQNGDPRKEQVAFAQTYFAIQTRKVELIEQRIIEQERVFARKKLSQTEKELSGVIYEQTGNDRNFAVIRSKGDKALFGNSTQQMKAKWKVPANRPLADFAPTIILKAKDFATEITIHNARQNNMNTEDQISTEHITNNQSVRKTLIERGIKPEMLKPDEDIKKLERRITSQQKNTLKKPDILNKKNKQENEADT